MPSLDRHSIFKLLTTQKGRLSGFGVQRLGLFGSFVRDGQSSGSDVDFLVEFQPGKKNAGAFFDVAECLEECLEMPVDLVTPEGLSPLFKQNIAREIRYFQP